MVTLLGVLLAALVIAVALGCLWRLPELLESSNGGECAHNVWGVDGDDRVVCLDCGRYL
jgi:hypothetical protein